jgi:hypothetical protein
VNLSFCQNSENAPKRYRRRLEAPKRPDFVVCTSQKIMKGNQSLVFLSWCLIALIAVVLFTNKSHLIDICHINIPYWNSLRGIDHTAELEKTPAVQQRKLESNINYDKDEIKNKKINVNFEKALEMIQKVSNLIYQRFEFQDYNRFQFFIGSSNFPSDAWDLIKYKVAQRVLLFQSGKTQNASYLMTFGGSSVTAGHDNYYQDAYPFVFERRMNDIFHELGMKLLVHNIAQGANNCRPSNYCYEAQGGDNPDFVGWEQSFNCGRSKDIFELVARIAYWSGGLIYYSASGAFLTNGCAPTKDPIPWTSEEWTPEKEKLTSRYEITPEGAKAYRNRLNEWYYDGNSVSRFTFQVYGGLYKVRTFVSHFYFLFF